MQKFRTYDVSLQVAFVTLVLVFQLFCKHTLFFPQKCHVVFCKLDKSFINNVHIRTREYVNSFKYPKCD